jgi:hypothetical protein
VVIDYFNILGAAVRPTEADLKLVVNAHAPLSNPIARELFQAIGGRKAHIFDVLCQIELLQFAQCGTFDIGEPPHPAKSRKGFVSSSMNDLIIYKNANAWR